MDKTTIDAVKSAIAFLATVAHNAEEFNEDSYEHTRNYITEDLKKAGFPEEVWGGFYDIVGCINPF